MWRSLASALYKGARAAHYNPNSYIAGPYWYIMTRKHFRAIAQILAKHKEVTPDNMVRDFANMCAEHNEYFNRETFIKACYYEEL